MTVHRFTTTTTTTTRPPVPVDLAITPAEAAGIARVEDEAAAGCPPHAWRLVVPKFFTGERWVCARCGKRGR